MTKKPNVLLLFSDQFRWDGINSVGNKIMVTPNLDSLCNDGTAFTRAYSPSPVCIPARMSMLYGQYPYNTGLCDNSTNFTPKQQNIMQVLSENNYYCHGIGKMHLVPDPNGLNGFCSRERQEELCSSTEDDEYLQYINEKGHEKVFDINGQRSEMYYIPQISQLPEKDHPTNWVGDRTTKFIKEYDKEEPFFLMSSFIHPHPPFSPPTPWNKIYRVPFVDGPFVPEDSEELLVHVNRVQNRYKYRDNGIDDNLIKTMRAYYYSCISFVDYQIGRIIDSLKEKGILDDTIIIFASDHGELLGDYNCVGKRCMLDSSAKIPFVIRYPSLVERNSICKMPVSLIDILPSLLDVLDIPKANLQLDGESIFKLINGTAKREYIYSQLSNGETGLYMLANENEKVIYSAADDKLLYFDTRVNQREEKNLINTVHYGCEALKIKDKLIQILKTNVPNAIDKNDFKKYPLKCVSENKNEGLIYQDQIWCREEESKLPDGYKVMFP